MARKLQRKGTYPIDDVLVHVRGRTNVKKKALLYKEFGGDKVKIRSDRLFLFKRKGTRCKKCGIEGEYFAKEKDPKDKFWHFNLYAVKDGEEILMTKDHTIPKSKGGVNNLSNYETMCIICNAEKGDTMPKRLPSKKKKTKPVLEKEIATLKSIMGGKDGTISRLTKEGNSKSNELAKRLRELKHLRSENEILRTRIRQLMDLLMHPVIINDETSGG